MDARRPTPVRTGRTDALLCSALLIVITAVQAWNMSRFPGLSDDEGTYLAQAWAVQQGEGMTHYTYWYDHPPLGWIQIAALTRIPAWFAPEAMTVGTMRYAMLGISAVCAILVYLLARRLRLPMWAAGLAMVLFGLSPLSVVLQRQIFLDNIAVMWMLVAFWLASSPNRHLWHHFAAGIAGAVSVLTKETMLLVLPALLVTMWRHSHRDTRKFAVSGAITGCFLIGLLYPLYALLNHELFPGTRHVSLIEGAIYQLTRPGSGSVLDPTSDSHSVLMAWLYYDRVLPVGGLLGAVAVLCATRWSVTARAMAGPALVVVILAVIALRPSGYLPAMYVIQALPFLALLLAALVASVAHLVLRRGRPTGRGREGRGTTVVRWTVAGALATGALLPVVPQWYDGNRTAMTEDANAGYRAAAVWMREEVPNPESVRVLVDDALWLDLVHAGYEPGPGVIWFYKADLDPAVTRTLPNGWRDVDYVVASPTVRRDAVDLPIVKGAIENSTPVAVFGTGEDRIEIRRIVGGDR
ncbi:phospholipid carrier-dependent glycosyltransferase [Streptomyces sp. ST2-7A]|nr:phospholipid carrier-dependent glycosyltransferase [Streptomyces sp. ST2-7A]MCE7079013.1 phospholipid carrier-dependent glycosyltransferase [Streptomyces sp. ST2-7A]